MNADRPIIKLYNSYAYKLGNSSILSVPVLTVSNTIHSVVVGPIG